MAERTPNSPNKDEPFTAEPFSLRSLSEVLARFPAANLTIPEAPQSSSFQMRAVENENPFGRIPENFAAYYASAHEEELPRPKTPLPPKLEKRSHKGTLLEPYDQEYVFESHREQLGNSPRGAKCLVTSPLAKRLSPVLEVDGGFMIPIETLATSGDPWAPPASARDNRVFGFKKTEVRARSHSPVSRASDLTFEQIFANDSTPSTTNPPVFIASSDMLMQGRIYDHLDVMNYIAQFDPYSREFTSLPRSAQQAMEFHQNRHHYPPLYQEGDLLDIQKAMNHIQWRKIVLGDQRDEASKVYLQFFLACEAILNIEEIEILINEILFLEEETRTNQYSDIEKRLINDILS